MGLPSLWNFQFNLGRMSKMGGSSWSDDAYTDRVSTRAATGAKSFAYDDDIKTGKVKAATHVALDPSKMKAGCRECRDSADHPTSNPIFVGLDVTGSMGKVPGMMQLKLKELMALLLKKGYIDDPAICVTGIGDAEANDRAPFQVGQFESGIEIENDLTNLYIEGGGGGNSHESYDLAIYFLARMTKTDAFEKRNKKGYAFIICDEALPSRCKASVLAKVFNVNEQADIPIETLVAEALSRWELYCIVPAMTSNFRTSLQTSWKNALGERVIFLDDPDTVVETIATCIGMCEEAVDLNDIAKDLADVGVSGSGAAAVGRALAKVGGGAISTKGTGLATL